ncbi:CaiB/BaiF CoA-transferase family protein [Rhodococcus sp. X156]|uniref:CaiB/BaiF CoA transferase family protein n=1 Tax=Rhodococcus sp. X156 TaxID=2499145 RepID=UPI000FD9F589|nr:CaiB/BaiF CoA-transferase family protein [Rhodococcus sp. X156]
MGPLSGYTVLEMAGIGPAPFAGMVLADLGADVICLHRASAAGSRPTDEEVTGRGRRSVAVDLKHPDGPATVLRLVESADALIEGFRPGVMERLGLGPQECLVRNPRLVFGRMTGWGQDGPLAHTAGHDISYISLSGALSAIGRAGQAPVPPLNLVGDYGGGAMLLATGVLAALLAVARGGEGQVVDAAMVDGSALLLAPIMGGHSRGAWGPRGTNLLDTGSPFYDVYETADGEHVSVGPIEPQFFAELVARLGLGELPAPQHDRAGWPELRARLTAAFAAQPRAHWEEVFAGSDACVVPVLSMAEAPQHPHNVARNTFFTADGITQPSPAPRFSATSLDTPTPQPVVGADTRAVLLGSGLSEEQVQVLLSSGAVAEG